MKKDECVVFFKDFKKNYLILSTACNQDADVIFLLDSSGSVSRDEFRQMKEFVISISEKFSIGYTKTRIGAAAYSSKAFLGFNLNTFNSANKLRNALSSLPYIYGNTNIAAGLQLVRNRMLHYKAGDRPQIQNFGKIHSENTFFLIKNENFLFNLTKKT